LTRDSAIPNPIALWYSLWTVRFGDTLSYAGRYSFRDHGFGDTHPQRSSIR